MEDQVLTLIITMEIKGGQYQPVGIKKESTALSNEMAALFMLEKAKDIVKVLHAPRVIKPQPTNFKPTLIDFLKRRRK